MLKMFTDNELKNSCDKDKKCDKNYENYENNLIILSIFSSKLIFTILAKIWMVVKVFEKITTTTLMQHNAQVNK